jgi:hypothetical protein
MADPLDDLADQFHQATNTAQKMMSGAKQAASQGYQQLKQTPGNISTIGQALQSRGISTAPPDSWDVGAAYQKAKSTLTGLWRGYVVPNLPSFLK